jgi:hypothetical protein
VYLTDFRLTKRSTSRSGLTGTGVFVGTLEYAAPEQFEGKPLGPQTDVYSLGCVLFECLTGEPPFRREQDAALMYAYLHDPPPSATARRPELPRGVDRVIEKAMAKHPVDRYATAGELAAALKGVTAGDRLPRPGRTHSQRKTWLAAAVAVIAVGVALTFVAFARGGGDPGSGGPSATAAASALPAGSLARIDPETGDASLPIPGVQGLGRDDDIQPNLAIGEGGVWISVWPGGDNPLLQHFDEATGEMRAQHQMKLSSGSAFPGFGLAVGSRTVWFSGADDGSRVSRINPATDEPLPPVSIDSGIVTDIVLGGERLWVGSGDGTLTAFDPPHRPTTGRTRDRRHARCARLRGRLGLGVRPARGRGHPGRPSQRTRPREDLRRRQPRGHRRRRRRGVGDGPGRRHRDPDRSPDRRARLLHRARTRPTGIAVGLGSAWVSDGEDGSLYRIDPELARATPIPLGAPLAVVAIDDAGRSVWVGAFAED